LAYVKPDLSLGPYTKLMLDQATVAYQKDPGTRRQSPGGVGGEQNFALSPEQMSNLKTMFQEAVFIALTKDDGYVMVDAPGPDVLRISAHLVDLVIKVPTEPTGGTRRQRTRSYGEVTVIFELRDSESEEILARVAERRDPTRNTDESLALVSPALVRTDMERLFNYWADQLREGLDLVREVGLRWRVSIGRP